MAPSDASTTLKNKAYRIIKQKIVTCALVPGSPVSEKELIQEIGVSRTPIREALARLENENLVRIFPKRGIFVTAITEKEIVDIYTMRACIESQAAFLAATYSGIESDIERFIAVYSPEDCCSSFPEHMETDRSLHLRIGECSRNVYLAQTIAKMYDLNSRIRYQHVSESYPVRIRESRVEHLEVLESLRRRDPEVAGEAMRRHIWNGMIGALRSFNYMPPLAAYLHQAERKSSGEKNFPVWRGGQEQYPRPGAVNQP